jgi:hypothetical protein
MTVYPRSPRSVLARRCTCCRAVHRVGALRFEHFIRLPGDARRQQLRSCPHCLHAGPLADFVPFEENCQCG